MLGVLFWLIEPGGILRDVLLSEYWFYKLAEKKPLTIIFVKTPISIGLTVLSEHTVSYRL